MSAFFRAFLLILLILHLATWALETSLYLILILFLQNSANFDPGFWLVSLKVTLLESLLKTKMASHCGFCGTAFWPYLKACKRCRTVYYCDRNCQKQDWIYHKISCTIDAKKALEYSLRTLPFSEAPNPLRVAKIPDKVNNHIVYGIFLRN